MINIFKTVTFIFVFVWTEPPFVLQSV